jgi:DNA-3-methyladenine glycosylase
MGLTKEQNGLDLLGDTLFITEGDGTPRRIGIGKRIGIDYAGEDAELPYRFFVEE